MRRIAVFLMALVMIACLGSVAYASRPPAKASQMIFMDITVRPFIAVNPNPWFVHFGSLYPGEVPPNPAETYVNTGFKEVAYSNVKFAVTLEGNNFARDGYPIFAREEKDEGGTGLGRWDRLRTHLRFDFFTNYLFKKDSNNNLILLSGDADYSDKTIQFNCEVPSNPGNKWSGTWSNGGKADLHLPHDGDIVARVWTGVWPKTPEGTTRLPHTTPDWYHDNSWWQSADAGAYSCWVLATYTQRGDWYP